MAAITWTPKQETVSKLKLWEQNPRTITKERFEKLKKRIQDRGFHDVIKVNTDLTILSGNQRKRALEDLGVETVWIMLPDHKLSKKEMEAVALESNETDGEHDWDALANFDLDFLKEITNFSDQDLAKGLNLQLDVEEDEAPEPRPNPNVKLGDLFQLGNHRLLCGDATKKDDVERLMDGQKADMVFTDPPYGVSYEKKATEILGRKDRAVVTNDDLGTDAIKTVVRGAFDRIAEVLKTGGPYYVCSPQGGELGLMMMMMMEAGIECRHMIVWAKDSPVFSMGRLDYDYQHEPILYGWRGSHQHYGAGKYRTSLWNIPRPKVSKLHPTMKPIELVANAIQNSSKQDDIVLDLFGGSGSTLIACEQLNRQCYMMEIDPIYCRVIIDRWEKLTGKKAVKL